MTTKASSLERESKTLNQEQGNIQTNPLTPERTEELKKRVEQLPQTPGPSNGDNPLAFLLRKMESLDEWLGGPPMSRRDRAERDGTGQEARTNIHLLLA
jgi:predicted Zn-dependent protease